MKWFYLALLSVLAACCPAPTLGQPTAFRGTVVGVSPDLSRLYLEPSPGAPLMTFTLPKSGVQTGAGTPVPLTALHKGDALYVQGTLRNGDLHAAIVRRLEQSTSQPDPTTLQPSSRN